MAMLAEVRDDITMDLQRPRAGSVDLWVRAVVVLAVSATLAILIAGPRTLWVRDSMTLGISRFWFTNALAIGFVTALVLACIPGGSRTVRVAVLLPFLQVVAMLVAWGAWLLLRSKMWSQADSTPLFDQLPVRVVLPWTALAIAVGARIVARRRRREWLHAMVMLALVNLLLLGLWLPIASNEYNGRGWHSWALIEELFDHPRKVTAFMLVPPFAGALVFTFTALRWPELWRRNTLVIGALLLVAVIFGIACRYDVSEIGAYVYVNFIHVIASAALVAVGAIVALGATTWIANARARRRLDLDHSMLAGLITSRHTIAICELASWLRGLRHTCNPFTVTTAYGEVPVPAGAHVITPTPLGSTLIRSGEAITTLRTGDRVVLHGYVHGTGDGPFRQTSAPIPGATGITVGRVDDERYGFTHVALDLWRPSIAYLLICVAVAAPALAALFSKQF